MVQTFRTARVLGTGQDRRMLSPTRTDASTRTVVERGRGGLV